MLQQIANFSLEISLGIVLIGFLLGETLFLFAITFGICLLLLINPYQLIPLVIISFTVFLLFKGVSKFAMAFGYNFEGFVKSGIFFGIIGKWAVKPIPDIDRNKSVQKFALDGNNLLGKAEWDLKKLKVFLEELKVEGFEIHLFFDYGVIRTLKENNLMLEKETVPMAVCRILEINKRNLTISKRNMKADPLLIRYADRNGCVVLSNDKFDKPNEDKLYAKAVERLKKRDGIRRVDLHSGFLTIM